MKRFNSTPLLLLITFSYCLIQGSFYPLFVVGISLLHELGHLLAIRFLGGKVEGLRGKGQGLEIAFSDLNYSKELLAAFAGPLTNLLLAAGLFPFILKSEAPALSYLFYANLMLAGINLLPIFPLDGGRMLACALATRLDPSQKERILQGVGIFFLLILLGLAFWQFLLSGYNLSLLLICLYLAVMITAQSKGAYS